MATISAVSNHAWTWRYSRVRAKIASYSSAALYDAIVGFADTDVVHTDDAAYGVNVAGHSTPFCIIADWICVPDVVLEAGVAADAGNAALIALLATLATLPPPPPQAVRIAIAATPRTRSVETCIRWSYRPDAINPKGK